MHKLSGYRVRPNGQLRSLQPEVISSARGYSSVFDYDLYLLRTHTSFPDFQQWYTANSDKADLEDSGDHSAAGREPTEETLDTNEGRRVWEEQSDENKDAGAHHFQDQYSAVERIWRTRSEDRIKDLHQHWRIYGFDDTWQEEEPGVQCLPNQAIHRDHWVSLGWDNSVRQQDREDCAWSDKEVGWAAYQELGGEVSLNLEAAYIEREEEEDTCRLQQPWLQWRWTQCLTQLRLKYP